MYEFSKHPKNGVRMHSSHDVFEFNDLGPVECQITVDDMGGLRLVDSSNGYETFGSYGDWLIFDGYVYSFKSDDEVELQDVIIWGANIIPFSVGEKDDIIKALDKMALPIEEKRTEKCTLYIIAKFALFHTVLIKEVPKEVGEELEKLLDVDDVFVRMGCITSKRRK